MNIWTFYFQIVHNRGHEVFNDEWTFGLHEPYKLQEKKKDWKDCQLCAEVVIMLKFAVFERL